MTEDFDTRLAEIKKHSSAAKQIWNRKSAYIVQCAIEAELKLPADVDWLIEQLELHRKALELACTGISSWGAYADEYFQEKHDLERDTEPETWLEMARNDKAE